MTCLMKFLHEAMDWISEVVGRGVNTQWWKSLFYFFAPLALMGFNGHYEWASPFLMAAIILLLAVAKQLIWDVWHLGADFDVIDVVMTMIAVLIGFMFTWNG